MAAENTDVWGESLVNIVDILDKDGFEVESNVAIDEVVNEVGLLLINYKMQHLYIYFLFIFLM